MEDQTKNLGQSTQIFSDVGHNIIFLALNYDERYQLISNLLMVIVNWKGI